MQENNNVNLNISDVLGKNGYDVFVNNSSRENQTNLASKSVTNIAFTWSSSKLAEINGVTTSIIPNNLQSTDSKNVVDDEKKVIAQSDISSKDSKTESPNKEEANQQTKLVNLLFSCIVIGLALLIIFKSLSVENIKNTFSQVKPNFPSLPTRTSKKAEVKGDSNSEAITKDKAIVSTTVKASKVASNSNSGESKGVFLNPGWQRIDELLASTDQRRKDLFSKVGIEKGEYVVACISLNCGNCEQVAKELNKKSNLDKIIAITNAPEERVKEWKERLGINYRIESVSERSFDDSGVVILPTLIRIKDAKAIGVSETADLIN